MYSRREFMKATLQTSTLVALAPTVPAFLAQTARAAGPDKDGRILVVLQLDGGNDGINTVVPFADEGYARHRRVLRLPTKDLIKLNDQVGLHPSLGDLAKLLESGQLAIVQGVGYPNPNRSHFESMAIWHTARLDPEDRQGYGWIGRALDGDRPPAQGAPASLFVGRQDLPAALRGRRSVASAMSRPEELLLSAEIDPRPALFPKAPPDDLAAFVQRSTLDAYATADRIAALVRAKDTGTSYPGSGLGSRLQLIARLLKAGMGTRVFYTIQAGYDTHAAQLRTHADLLFELSIALQAFLKDLTAAGLAERVVVLAFSEFGRRVAENDSEGTDHGTAGPVFLVGPGVQGGLVGKPPRLLDLEGGDLRMGLDFRQVYASVLEDWLGLPSRTALDGDFTRLRLIRG